MNGFKAAFSAEIKKSAGKKKIKVAVILCLAAVILGTLACTIADNLLGISMTGKAELSLTLLPVFLKFIIPLFTLFMCIDMFGGEFSSGTMKTTLLTGASRFDIFFSKAAVLGVFVLFMLAFSLVSSYAASLLVGKTSFALLRVLFSYAISFFPLMTFGFMCTLISNIVKGSGAAFMLTVLIYMAHYVLGMLFPVMSTLFFTSGFDVYVLLSSPLLGLGKIIRTVLILVGYGALFAGLGEYLFERKEF